MRLPLFCWIPGKVDSICATYLTGGIRLEVALKDRPFCESWLYGNSLIPSLARLLVNPKQEVDLYLRRFSEEHSLNLKMYYTFMNVYS